MAGQSDEDGAIGASLLTLARGFNRPARAIICVRQEHPLSSTVADFLISQQIQFCTAQSPACIEMLDVPWHPITRKIAVGQGFEQHKNNPPALIKIALGLPVTDRTWGKIRLSIERLSGLGLQSKCPNYRTPIVSLTAPDGEIKEVGLFELETLLSPTIFILPGRDAVIVPITRTFAADLLGTDLQYSLLEKPEAQFLFRRTYLACTRFRRHRVRCFNGTGGGSWRGGSLHESSSLKRCG